jgi:hypothetical protein
MRSQPNTPLPPRYLQDKIKLRKGKGKEKTQIECVWYRQAARSEQAKDEAEKNVRKTV